MSVRMTLSTLTYACFYKLHVMFFPEGSGSRVFTYPLKGDRKCLVNLMKSL